MAESFEITDKVKRVLKTVIERCVLQAEPTSRHSLRTELDGPTLQALIRFRYLRIGPRDQYWPGIIAFEDCGEKWLLDVGRLSRTAAIAGISFYVLIVLNNVRSGIGGPVNPVMGFFIIVGFIRAVRGTFAFHRMRQRSRIDTYTS